MELEYDESKNQKNIIERGLPFSMIEDFDFEKAIFQQDERISYENRIISTSLIVDDIYTIVFTRRIHKIRIISFRIASRKERKTWLAAQTLI